jgi:hypothetical protein
MATLTVYVQPPRSIQSSDPLLITPAMVVRATLPEAPRDGVFAAVALFAEHDRAGTDPLGWSTKEHRNGTRTLEFGISSIPVFKPLPSNVYLRIWVRTLSQSLGGLDSELTGVVDTNSFSIC